MKKLLLIVVTLAFSLAIHAQETVTLVVNGEGKTKEDATANALRSAIKQSYGVFVSANTQILNDKIVKDEIATIASGNIQEYKELGCVTMPDGRKSISLSATVSIPSLISYAKSKGSSTEFAGAIWGMNIKMRKLNAENERMAVDHLLKQLDILSRDMFKIELSTPNPPVKINWDDYQYSHLKKSYSSQPYFVDFNLTYYTTSTCKLFFDLLFNSLQSISLSDDEIKAYKESGEPMYELKTIDNGQLHISNGSYNIGGNRQSYYFRNDIVETIISSISVSFGNALLPHWQIVRSSTDKGDDSITFKNYCNSWRSYPQNRIVEWSRTPLVNRRSNEWIEFDFLPDVMNGDETQITTFNIKIGFTEEELSKTTGFKITKREGCDVSDIQSSNEIWCTFPSYSKLEREAKPKCSYNAKNSCWVLHFDRDLTRLNEYYRFRYYDLTSIIIPNSVTAIEPSTFRGCTSLKSIKFLGSLTVIDNYTFSFLDKECVVHVPMGSTEDYRSQLNDADFRGRIVEMSSNSTESKLIKEEAKVEEDSNLPEDNTDPEEPPVPFQLLDQKPSFQGGDANTFAKWVSENQIYPETAKASGVQGRVIVSGVINTDGSLSDLRVLRGCDPSLDKEALRVISQSPKWTPGVYGGRTVRVSYTFTVYFYLR